MTVDLMLRCTWIFTLTVQTPADIAFLGLFDIGSLIMLALIVLELYRRMMWAKYRIEVETMHLKHK